MRSLPLLVCTLLLQVPAKADKFWLSDPNAPKNSAEGSMPNIITGVLIAESDEGYHVRIVGGEVILPKKSVRKIEKDDLSIDAIVKMEKDNAAAQDAANKERAMAQAAARRAADVKAVEAASKRAAAPAPAPAAAEVPATSPAGFDPIVGVDRSVQGMSNVEMQRDMQLAWTLTKDRRYLVALRQLRRLN